MAKLIDCPKGEQDLSALYLAGELPEGEAQAFEKHYFECESCWQDVQRGSELRATLGNSAVASAAPHAAAIRRARSWLPLAAAAAIAFVGIGVWQLTRQSAVESSPAVMRSSVVDVLALEVSGGPQGSVDVAWASHSEASSYRVQVLGSDGLGAWKKEVSETHLKIVPGDVAPSGKQMQIQVEALDAMGQVVATSERIPLPRR